MARQTFAIGIGGQMVLWCTGNERRFEVINGAWTGRLKDGLIYVLGRGEDRKPVGHGEVMWRGIVPREHADCYNEAILWIRDEVKRGVKPPRTAPSEGGGETPTPS
jgi:hypothetical protein